MHILILPSEEYIPTHNPLAGIFQHDQAKILMQNGNQVGSLSFSFNYSIFSLVKAIFGKKNNRTQGLSPLTLIKLLFKQTFLPYATALTTQNIDGLTVLRCEGTWGTKKNNMPLSTLEMWYNYGDFALKKYIKKYGRPDIIHAHNIIYAGLLASYLKQKYQIPIVITEHSSHFAIQPISSPLTKKIKELLNDETQLYAVSPELIKLIETRFKDIPHNKIKWLPNVLDPFIENMPLNTIHKVDQTIRFLNIASLIPIKGQEDLIRAFYKAFSTVENVELIIAGEGPLIDELTALVHELNLQQKITFIGLINRQEVIEQLDQCDVLVLPSHYETFGVVLIESLSRGIPVISTTCGGPECIVDVTNGILVTPKDVDGLANALINLTKKYKSFDKATLRSNCLQLFGKDSFYKKVFSIYNNALQS